MNDERRLVAILAVDVAVAAALPPTDEEGTVSIGAARAAFIG